MAESGKQDRSTLSPPERRERAMQIVTHYVWWSAGWGFVPVPMLDVFAVMVVQLRMVDRLSHFYGVRFSRNRGKAVIASLLGGLLPVSLARGTLGSLFRSIPFVGQIVGMVTTPLFDGASTYAVGKVFIEQFESGGTFLDFDPDDWRDQFGRYFDEGKDVVASGPGGAEPQGQPVPKPAKA